MFLSMSLLLWENFSPSALLGALERSDEVSVRVGVTLTEREIKHGTNKAGIAVDAGGSRANSRHYIIHLLRGSQKKSFSKQ